MKMIHWCEICSQAPSDGILTVVRHGESEQDYMQACHLCVSKLDETDWIENAI